MTGLESQKKASLAAAEGGGERTPAGVTLPGSLGRLRRSLAVPKGPPVRASGVSGRDCAALLLMVTCVSVGVFVCSGLGFSIRSSSGAEIWHVDVFW